MKYIFHNWVNKIPLTVALLLVFGGGIFLLDKSDKLARDTVRKHHLEDIEKSLYVSFASRGTFPPYDKPVWCGLLSAPENAAVREHIETALRSHNKQYANTDKPFPTDPLYDEKGYDYFYWKRSPAVFELYAKLEEDKTGEKNTIACDNAPTIYYDYGLNSSLRQSLNGQSI